MKNPRKDSKIQLQEVPFRECNLRKLHRKMMLISTWIILYLWNETSLFRICIKLISQ